MTEPPSDSSDELIVPNDADSIAFVKGLVERGEAVAQPEGGKLPPKATHLIVGQTDAGHPVVKRVRFSAF